MLFVSTNTFVIKILNNECLCRITFCEIASAATLTPRSLKWMLRIPRYLLMVSLLRSKECSRPSLRSLTTTPTSIRLSKTKSNIGFAADANKTLLDGMPQNTCTTLLKFQTKESRYAETSYQAFTIGNMLVWWMQSWATEIGSNVIVCGFAFLLSHSFCLDRHSNHRLFVPTITERRD